MKMKGSITFRFGGDIDDYHVYTSREGELDSRDLETVAALLNEDIILQRSIELGEVIPTPWDPTGRGQVADRWSN
jgi:hypothetical protein